MNSRVKKKLLEWKIFSEPLDNGLKSVHTVHMKCDKLIASEELRYFKNSIALAASMKTTDRFKDLRIRHVPEKLLIALKMERELSAK